MAYTSGTLNLTQTLTAENEKQLIDLLTPVYYGQSFHNRKDAFTLKLNVYTGGNTLHVLVYIDSQDDPIEVGMINNLSLTDQFIDVGEIIGTAKSWQFRLIGLLSDFKLTEIVLDYIDRPEPLSYFRELIADTGPYKKRIRTWPFVIDTLGKDVIVTPYVDNVAYPDLTVNSDYPKTFLYQFITDVFGIDYALVFHDGCDFELYKIYNPLGVQTLPIARRYCQVGSSEFFRYGKLKSFVTRLIAFGGTTIPFTIYFADADVYTNDITVEDGKEDTFSRMVPKTIAGQIVRIEFGPTNFDFHLFYVNAQVAKSGRDTELEWVPLNVQGQSE